MGNAPASQMTVDVPAKDLQKGPTSLARQDGPIDGDQLLAQLERRETLLRKLRDMGLKATWSEQWTNMDGKPWPTTAAAEVIARSCAVSVSNTRWEKVKSADDEGEFYYFVYTGMVSLPTGIDAVEAIGTCSSRDQFIGTGTGANADKPSEINEDDIMKAAYSNLLVNGIMRLLGLRGMTWEMLAQFGLDKEKAAKIEHKGGGRGGGKNAPIEEKGLPFGRSKGKKISEAAAEDLAWVLERMKADVASTDPDKVKWREGNEKWVSAITAELARRANVKAGIPASNGAAGPSIFERIQALPEAKGVGDLDMREIIKASTGRASSKELVESDIAKVRDALIEWRRKTGTTGDINF